MALKTTKQLTEEVLSPNDKLKNIPHKYYKYNKLFREELKNNLLLEHNQ